LEKRQFKEKANPWKHEGEFWNKVNRRMTDKYKTLERDHYNQRYSDQKSRSSHINYTDLVNSNATEKFYSLIEDVKRSKGDGKILDYGCGAGSKSYQLVDTNWQLVGIDISEKSIEQATILYGDIDNLTFEVMDCENTTFSENTFDIIIDYGTFSSISLEAARSELKRILKPDGIVVCIETLGHNPFTNLKRKVNVIRKKRTKWAQDHIMKVESWSKVCDDYSSSEMYYFNFVCILIVPLLSLLPHAVSLRLIKIMWKLDGLFFTQGLLKRYAFKTVVVLRGVKGK
jgi:ubiquinone/menaquinone biosynthesis C-methylase UbiE